MILHDVMINNYRDDFTYAGWQRDYLLIKSQAEVTIKNLEENSKKKHNAADRKQLNNLKKQLQAGNFSQSWILLSQLFINEARDLVTDRIIALKSRNTPTAKTHIIELEKILQSGDYRRLWNEPQLLTETDEYGSPLRLKIRRIIYKYIQGKDLRHMASSILGGVTLASVGIGAAWLLKTGFSLKSLWPPDPLKFKNAPARPELKDELFNTRYNKIRWGYRRRVLWATVFGFALIPFVAITSGVIARAMGQDWDFKKQLTMMGMRAYAAIGLPFWHRVSDL